MSYSNYEAFICFDWGMYRVLKLKQQWVKRWEDGQPRNQVKTGSILCLLKVSPYLSQDFPTRLAVVCGNLRKIDIEYEQRLNVNIYSSRILEKM